MPQISRTQRKIRLFLNEENYFTKQQAAKDASVWLENDMAFQCDCGALPNKSMVRCLKCKQIEHEMCIKYDADLDELRRQGHSYLCYRCVNIVQLNDDNIVELSDDDNNDSDASQDKSITAHDGQEGETEVEGDALDTFGKLVRLEKIKSFAQRYLQKKKFAIDRQVSKKKKQPKLVCSCGKSFAHKKKKAYLMHRRIKQCL